MEGLTYYKHHNFEDTFPAEAIIFRQRLTQLVNRPFPSIDVNLGYTYGSRPDVSAKRDFVDTEKADNGRMRAQQDLQVFLPLDSR